METSREALRCLANALLLNEPCRQTFVDLHYASKAAERLKVDSRDDEFLISRILFLLTYNTNVDFDMLEGKHELSQSINQHISRHAKNFSKDGRRQSVDSQMEDMSMTETSKLLFNLTYYHPDMVSKFTPSVEPLIDIILYYPLQTHPLQPPLSVLLNALLNLDLKAPEKKTRDSQPSSLFPYANLGSMVERLATIFDAAMKTQSEKDLDQAAAPLCTLLRTIYEIAAPQMKCRMRSLLLPTAEDRDQPLGQGQTLSSRLLRLSNSPSLPNLRDNISSLLFELSDKNATTFVQNIGYGFASGFLMSHNIEVPISAMEANSKSSRVDIDGDFDINPITGQKLSAESRDAPVMEEMTEEEKEREAERLYVLFERLKAMGVMEVRNPVHQAVDEGRFQELDD